MNQYYFVSFGFIHSASFVGHRRKKTGGTETQEIQRTLHHVLCKQSEFFKLIPIV